MARRRKKRGGARSDSTRSTLRFEVKDILFVHAGPSDPEARVVGSLRVPGVDARFRLSMKRLNDGRWGLVHQSYPGLPPALLESGEVTQGLVNASAKMLYPVNMWADAQGEHGARIVANQQLAPADVRDRVFFSLRPDMIALPSPAWERLWWRIERRAEWDPHFAVNGFSREEVLESVPVLKAMFPAEWVKARCQPAEGAAPHDPDSKSLPDHWFPAYTLWYAARGVTCVDPAWNYLVEIAQALGELDGVPGLSRAQKQLTRSPGVRHAICLAAVLKARGLLLGLEPKMGGGFNDLDCSVGGVRFHVELKELTGASPRTALRDEIEEKVKKLPREPEYPVILHVVWNQAESLPGDSDATLRSAAESVLPELPARISAVVVSSCCVDAGGGRTKWRLLAALVNPDAVRPITEAHLRAAFASTGDPIMYPTFGIGPFMHYAVETPSSG